MVDDEPIAYTTAIFDELTNLALADFCALAGIQAALVHSLVDEGILEPPGASWEHWLFSGHNVLRAQRALRLREDLGLDLASVAMMLPLLDEIIELRRQRRILLRRLGD